MEIDKRRILISCVVIVLGLLVYVFRNWPIGFRSRQIQVETESTVSAVEESTEEDSPEESTSQLLSPVYICGAVKNPGIYETRLPVYLFELIDLAGGLADGADQEKIDLVYQIKFAQSIYLPYEAETTDMTDRQWNDFIEITTDPWSEPEKRKESEEGKININTADAAALSTLPGIGEKTAESILAYRQEHGTFSRIDDIKQVSGIGESKYEKIKDRISV